MINQFPSPILSVAADVVQELEGEDALYSLWALFTKCKESLKDGRRLENISWRLWYREMSAAQHSPLSTPGSATPVRDRSPTPITPVSDDGAPQDRAAEALLAPAPAYPAARSWHGEKAALPALPGTARRLSTASVPMRSPSSVHVGKMILEILPAKPLVAPKAPPPPKAPPLPKAAPPPPALPTVQLPATPPPASSNPRVVVVNPTPHPTPPATPHASHAPPAPPPAPPSAHLLPPPALRPLTSAPRPGAKPRASLLSRDAPVFPERREDLRADRRFFLEEAESPERDSPDSAPRVLAAPSPPPPDAAARSPGSASSNVTTRSDAVPATAARRPQAARAQSRKGRETVRHAAAARPPVHRAPAHAQARGAPQRRSTAEGKKAAFNIGSLSSNGSRSAEAGPSKPPAAPKPQQQPQQQPQPQQQQQQQQQQPAPHPRASPPKHPTPPTQQAPAPAPAAAQGRRGIVLTSSEYETTDTDDDSEWASEDNGGDDRERARERQREETRLRAAAEEAQRQRDMFAKIPKRSYSSLNRTQSGLLSQLLNPDPSLFPPAHPYRSSRSTVDMTQLARQGHAPPALQTSKSSVAVPQAAAVTAQAPSQDRRASETRPAETNGYRPKGRPQSAELEEDSDTGDETTDNGLEVSRSIAQQKLAALTDPARRRNSDRSIHTQPPPSPAPAPALPSVATAPIPLGHPYNLPAPPAPMTPRTTRRQMLSTELSESLRRNLLWERQVSKVNLTNRAARRGGVLGDGLRPLTTVNAEPSNAADRQGNGSAARRESAEKDARMARNKSWAADDYHYAGW